MNRMRKGNIVNLFPHEVKSHISTQKIRRMRKKMTAAKTWRGVTTYRVQGVQTHDSIPFRPLVRVEP